MMGALTATMPTSVSRTPQRLMVSLDGACTSENAVRIMAAVMTKRPEERRSPMRVFLNSFVSGIE